MAAAPGVRRSELGEALRACRSAFIGVGAMSCMINLLYLTGSIFMLEIYDRVLPSRSVPTLVGLVILAGGLYIAQGILDLIRGRILGRIGTSLDEALNARVFDIVVRLPLTMGGRNEGLQPLRDLDNVRGFLGTMGPGAFFDLPWLPFYLAICFAFHVLIGVTALVGAVILVTLTLVTEFMSRAPAREAMSLAARRNDLAATSRRNAEVLVAMGMVGRLNQRWSEANEKYLAGNQRASDVAGGLGAVAKVLRMMLQSGVLAVGAYLVIYQLATAGIIIAGSILSARALAPVDLAIANWRGFVGARQGWKRLTDLLALLPSQTAPVALQPPAHIVGLPDGYETQVGESGTALSAGQAQRVALARALYGDPFLVVLDEPNSNLDAEGDEALSRAIMNVRTRGGIVVVVAHRPSAIAGVDLLMMMNQGRIQAFGPKDEVLSRVLQRDGAAASRALKVVPEAGAVKS